jgi:hypothetical protein
MLHRNRRTATYLAQATVALILHSISISAGWCQGEVSTSPPLEDSPLLDPRYVAFYIADGRIYCVVKTKQNHRASGQSKSIPRQELTLDAGSTPSVRFFCEYSNGDRFIGDFQAGEVEFTFTGSIAQTLTQNRHGEIQLNGNIGRTFPSFWHLLLVEGKTDFGQRLIEVLHLLRPDWALDDRMESIATRLQDDQDPPVSRESVSRWVAELASSEFGIRRNADRALRDYGHQVVPQLRQLDSRRLNAEQRRRIRYVVSAFKTETEDDSIRTASRLAADVWVWCHLLDAEEDEVRRLAVNRMNAILAEPLQFDTTADSAGRRVQLARIQKDLQLR